jgi:predicted enzyme related to lactoylglutathione lyase
VTPPRLRLAGTVLSTPDPDALATFYEHLLGWPRRGGDETWVVVRPDDQWAGLSFHLDEEYVRPVWPSRQDAQQMQVHLDIATDDLEAAVAHAIACGARPAEHQPQPDVRVMLDPDGHPFCLFPYDWD